MEKNRTILLVEDDTSTVEVYSDELKEKGYEVICINNGREALELLNSKKINFNIIIIDLKLPKMDGEELIKKIRNNHINIPIIICTAYPFKNSFKKLYEKLTDAIFTKPVDLDILTNKINELIKQE